MLRFVSLCFGTVVRLFHARRSLLIENLALRQQLAAIIQRNNVVEQVSSTASHPPLGVYQGR
jgi:hypothetical protein